MSAKHPRKNRRPASHVATSFEGLENRICMAGDVTVAINGNVLSIVGDQLGNQILVDQVDQSFFRVIGQQGTTVNGLAAQIVPFNPAGNDLRIDLKGGDDILQLNNLAFGQTVTLQKLRVDMGAGNDRAELGGFAVIGGDPVDITLGKNNQAEQDFLRFDEAVFNGGVTIATGGGTDEVLTNDMVFIGGLQVSTAGGDDRVAIDDTTVLGDLKIATGDGNDRIAVQDTVVSRDLVVDAGKGNDEYIGGEFNGLVRVDRNLVISGGDGNDLIQVNAGLSPVTVLGSLAVSGGKGDDFLGLGNGPLQVTGRAAVDGGAGNDTVAIKKLSAGELAVDFRGGSSTLSVAQVGVTGKATFVGGDGSNAIAMNGVTAGDLRIDYRKGRTTADLASVTAQAFAITTGKNADAVTLRDSTLDRVFAQLGNGHDTLTAERITNRSTAIDAGGGNDSVRLTEYFVVPQAGVGGDLTIRGGAGNDTVSLDLVVAATAVFDGGNGTDTLDEGNVLFNSRTVKKFEVVQ